MPKIIFQPLMIANPPGRLAEDFLLGTPGENFIWLFLVVLVSLFDYFSQKSKKPLKRLGGIKLLSYFCSNCFHHAFT